MPTTISRRQFTIRSLQGLGGLLAAGALPCSVARAIGTVSPRQAIAEEIDRVLWEKIVPAWYPRCIEKRGGFHERFDRGWNRLPPARQQFLVFQARMTWTPAFLAVRFPERRDEMRPYVEHGLAHLQDRMWDAEHGGFLDHVSPDDDFAPPAPAWKNLYAQSFGLFAAAAAYEATNDAAALALARKSFTWLEQHAHDPEHGGYFEQTTRDGTPVLDAPPSERGAIIGRLGCKSMNAHIHMLEALTGLYRVWKDDLVRERLIEVFHIVRDKIVAPEGHLVMFADPQWRPVDAYSSFGHELEIIYLLDETLELLQLDDETEATHRAMAALARHSMQYGRDREHGGFYYEGPADEIPEGNDRRKSWWTQVEAFNGLLTAHRRLEADRDEHWAAFVEAWQFFRDRMVDHEHGGCFGEVADDGRIDEGSNDKASPWKTAYHVVRALVNSSTWLKERPPTQRNIS